MLNVKLVNSVISHTNRKYLLNGLLNGTNRWFYDVMSQLQPHLEVEATREMLCAALENYLETLHRVYRRAGMTLQTYSEFYHENDDTTKVAMIYLLKTLKTLCGNFYLAAILALWVELERSEDAYGEYVRMCTGQENDGKAAEVNPFLLYNFVCSTFAAVHEAGLQAAA
ncbi:MAG: hypothetical protein M0P16_00325 [Syntrophales bacterium]|jgi:hypothetical protein|nr:hypothetical protein [Syntrophales bacterium]